jgi:ubiquinone biosynthesis protein COQ4
MSEYKLQPILAYKSLKHIINKNPKKIIFVSQVVKTLSGPSLKWCYNKLLQTQSGGKIAYEREEINDYFCTLKDRPVGSVGEECIKMFPDQEFLLKISKRKHNDSWIEAKHPYSWMARRYRDTHDTWHVLTGYPPTGLGEMCITMFSFAQTGSLAWLALSLTTFLAYPFRLMHVMMLVEAYRNGKAAKFLLAEDYNKLFSENLEDARHRLNIKVPRYYMNNFSI